MQKALVVTGKFGHKENETLAKLNSHLQMGWKIVHSCPMPSSGSVMTDMNATCFVVIEKEEVE